MKRNNHENFKEELYAIYGDLYDFSKTKYLRIYLPVIIGCRVHGYVSVTAQPLLKGKGCPLCNREKSAAKRRTTLASFLERSYKVHGNTYDYSKVEYSDSQQRVTIVCHIHGDFQIRPTDHLRGKGCQKCAFKRRGRKPKNAKV